MGPEPGMSLRSKMERNAAHFQANYLLIVGVFLIITLVSHPARLLAAVVTLGAWALYARAGGLDPFWRPKVGGMELSSTHRLMILAACSLVFLLAVAGDAILTIAFLSGALA